MRGWKTGCAAAFTVVVLLVSWSVLTRFDATAAQARRAETTVGSVPGARPRLELGALFDEVPAPVWHYEGTTADAVQNRFRERLNYQALVREQSEGQWFAALVATTGGNTFAIERRWKTWRELLAFLSAQNALVDVWAYPESGMGQPRRITAAELARLKGQRFEQPTFITVTYPSPETGEVVTRRVEFGFGAAASVLSAQEAYQRHRQFQLALRAVLSARDADGRLSAIAQFEALQAAVREGRLALLEMPPRPRLPEDLFMAGEFEVDEGNCYSRVVRVYRESDIVKGIDGTRQVMVLKKPGEKSGREVAAFCVRGASDELVPVPQPIPGQDLVELRIQVPGQADPRKWPVLEFGEPELLQHSALAKFGLINAYVDKRRKARAVKKANLDLIAEPIIAGLSIGGGLAGVPFPIGEAARLGYNALVAPRFIAPVPSVAELRELLQLMAAAKRRPELRTRPGDFLNADDFRRLQEAAKNLTEAEVVDFLRQISDDDLRGMVRLAKMQRLDAKLTNLLSILADAAKVSGWADEAGFQRDLLNSIYFSTSGEASLKNIIAVLAGGSVATPHSGFSLRELSQGDGPAAAWLQYLNVTVDLRAVVNTVARLSHRNLASQELKKPFPYAPRLTDLAAYEIRVFGFPLLIFHKRGLLQRDLAAYANDYAYGVVGTRIVEHFPTREAMEAEIRAGRMAPLGYVRVLDSRGQWKDTSLAVFAHRVTTGKDKAETAIILYGLKAYADHSHYVERELQRFRQFEQGLREGAVLEQCVNAEDRAQVPAEAFEPVLHMGPAANDELYAPRLSGLLEWRRAWQRRAWGLPLAEDDRQRLDAIREEFAIRGLALRDENPLLEVDSFGSAFLYRNQVQGQWRDMKVTRLVGLADIERERRKAEEGVQISQLRAEVAAGKVAGVVFLNEVREVNGRCEIGPLRQDASGGMLGVGVASGPKAMNDIWSAIDRLSVTDQARLRFNNYASTVVELEPGAGGARERVFLTIEFPPGEVKREWINPRSGEGEVLVFVDGLWRRTLTDHRWVEMEYDLDGIEAGSRTYDNRGTRQAPLRGELLEETRTLEVWFRDLSQPKLDPYLPMMAKLRIDCVTGRCSRDTHGLFPLPVQTVDDQYLTHNRYDAHGVFESATISDNGRVEADFQRAPLAKVLQPLAGQERFQLTATVADPVLLKRLAPAGGTTTVERKDLVKGLTTIEVLENARAGRKLAEHQTNDWGDARSFSTTTLLEYRPDFHYGAIPHRTTLRSAWSGVVLGETSTVGYDPSNHRLTARVTDYTGRISTNLWDYRWRSPVEQVTELRRTTNHYNREETAVTGTTFTRSTGERVSSFSGQYDAASRQWRLRRSYWHRTNVLSRTETSLHSGEGRWIATRWADERETRPLYSPDGIEVARQTWQRNPATDRFDLLLREEEDYRWQKGNRDARITIHVEGRVVDEYRSVSDGEGRTIVEGIRQLPGLDLRTVVSFDGETDRMLEAEVWQNQHVRVTRHVQAAEEQSDGTYVLRVTELPFWGLARTNTYRLNDPLGRSTATVFENGDRAEVTEWFAHTALPKVTELRDRQGRVKERIIRRLNAGTAGIPYDLATRYQVGFWGNTGFAEERAGVRGTDLAWFSETSKGRVYFDLTQPFDSPAYAVAPRGHSGIWARVGETRRPSVTAVFRTSFRDRSELPANGTPAERVMDLEEIDLGALLYHQFTRRTLDRAGRILEEQTGRIRNLGARDPSETVVWAAANSPDILRRVSYRYEPGWMVEQPDARTGEPMLAFSPQRPSSGNSHWPVNEAGGRDRPTEISAEHVAGEDPAAATDSRRSLFRRLENPRELKQNPFLPDSTNVWWAWTGTEINEEGQDLFRTETIYDAQGWPSTTLACKRNRAGRPANKITYRLPQPAAESWRTWELVPGRNQAGLTFSAPLDLSGSDFLAFFVERPGSAPVELTVQDALGQVVTITPAGRPDDPSHLAFWAMAPGQVQWLPNEARPERGAVVSVPADGAEDERILAVSVPELARAGLEVHRLTAATLSVFASEDGRLRVSPVYRLAHQGPFIANEGALRFTYTNLAHANGMQILSRMKERPTPGELRTRRGWDSVAQIGGRSIATLKPREAAPFGPMAILLDGSDPDAPRPLYALALEDGRFLEYYRTGRWGNAQVQTIVSGFETPKLEVQRAGILDDDLSPGLLTFGHDHQRTVPLAKTREGIAGMMANLHNRLAASVFRMGGDNLLELFLGSDPGRTGSTRFTREDGGAAAQANAIVQLPMLAQALLLVRDVPWQQPATSPPPAVDLRTNALRTDLVRLASKYPQTKLIPTALNTEAERFVDTVQEADLVQLAVKLNECSVAAGMLQFYLDCSLGGTRPLHACYDAQTEQSLVKDPGWARPAEASPTAAAQLAVAEAAFSLGLATGDAVALRLGENLVTLVLDQFRPGAQGAAWPRGIAERPPLATQTRHGITLWPATETYSLQSNARAYLLLLRLHGSLPRLPVADEWKLKLTAALAEQEAWLKTNVVPHAENTGVVPKGLFQIQDVPRKTTALAVERWTAAEDWLTFLEAAEEMGLARETTRRWLENLARTHGATVAGVWGLDWSIPWLRPDAISPELTAKFARVAGLLGHRPAAEFAQRNLQAMSSNGEWPRVVTAIAPAAFLQTGQGSSIFAAHPGPATGGTTNAIVGWPRSLAIHLEQMEPGWPAHLRAGTALVPAADVPRGDLAAFLETAAGFYLAIVAAALFWWSLSALRKRRLARAKADSPGPLVSDLVMRKAEERWAKRVLGVLTPPNADRSRYSNGAGEQSFHVQLRVIYKLVLEWRRLANGWAEDDPRLVEDGQDEWLNGSDEFAVLVGLYSRWVIKAGKKDGGRQRNAVVEHEDSNHLWARLLVYFSDSHRRLLQRIHESKAATGTEARAGVEAQIERELQDLGLRRRASPCDARTGFNAPADPAALDLMVVQSPGADLPQLLQEMEKRLQIPREHVERFIRQYQSFKRREQLYPVHPYLLDAAKLLPHVILTGLLALIWYNHNRDGLPIYPYLKEKGLELARDWHSLAWAGPLLAGYLLCFAARLLSIYGSRPEQRSAAPRTRARASRWGEPAGYAQAGWMLRAIGFIGLGLALLRLETPSFALFMFVKGLLAILFLVEAGGILVPLVVTWGSRWLEDRTSGAAKAWRSTRFLNQLNFPATRSASLLWLSLRYHFQPSVFSGGILPITQAILFYLVFATAFFAIGGYVYKEALRLWFKETYQAGWDLGLVIGGILFWNTMYLLRYGLFVFFAAGCASLVTYPLRTLGAVLGITALALQLLADPTADSLRAHPAVTWTLLLLGLALMWFEESLLARLKTCPPVRSRRARRQQERRRLLEQIKTDGGRTLGVVYMSGDDLSCHKLPPDLLMTRWTVLRDRLDSEGLRLLSALHSFPDDTTLAQSFRALHELEKKSDVTLWHPLQVVVAGETPRLRRDSGLNLVVDTPEQRQQMLDAWHRRRWLVTMMSTAGQAQDTGINLVDFALRLTQEGLGARTVFYLIQNKYDNADTNRPSQAAYDRGELGHRNKLAHLLMELAPGSRAYSLNNWTPFGFKAGGLVAMDLVYEESLELTSMLVLDRNANTHDLEALMEDVTTALVDPGVVVVVPGRGTTNTHTAIGQASQLVEEGHRAHCKGLMLMGGRSGETLGTGWGNIQAVYYGQVQQALLDPATRKAPLTPRQERGLPFGDRFEGLIGFGPHAVGISEDVWAVTQNAHNAMALGYRVKFERSQAFWHKMRETWSHAEWFSAFPRWSGGYLQLMLDPIMQRISDFGPLSLFAKELRANGGRFFLAAPFALLSFLLMPLAILWDVSPFVQVLIILWNFGFIMNQVLTSLGLVAYLERSGFYQWPALGGALLTGISTLLWPGLKPFAPALITLGFLASGFSLGLGRWLFDRGRDLILFGPQLVIHALGQVVRQSLEFVVSGASANDAHGVNIAFRAWVGPREDRPLETYQNIINLRSVVWGVGLGSLGLNLFALSKLDFLNVLLLLPSLLFSVSALIGPFVMKPPVGRHLGRAVWIPRLAGWMAGFVFYTAIAGLIAAGGWRESLGAGLIVLCFGWLLRKGLKYLRYPQQLRGLTSQLTRILALGGLTLEEARPLARQLLQNASPDGGQSKARLQQSAVSPDQQSAALQFLKEKALPVLQRPMADLREAGFSGSRFFSESGRAFVIALFVFLWFFVVPIPGLLVFQVDVYRVSMSLVTLFAVAGAVVALALGGVCLSRLMEAWVRREANGCGLLPRIKESHRQFQALRRESPALTAAEDASLYALFTDAQTYIDQRSYAYARRTLGLIEKVIETVSRRPVA